MMIVLALAIIVVIVLLICYNAYVADDIADQIICSISISILLVLLLATIYCPPCVGIDTNYYINHQSEFVVDTISVNGVITELKIREK